MTAVERSFKDRYGLLARDLRDAAVVRLNALVPTLFNYKVLKPGAPGGRSTEDVPQRFLAACLERYPYFTRLDLRADRGRRPLPEMVGSDDPAEVVER